MPVILITLVPLSWLLAATMTAGVQKIWHPDPRIGFLAQARVLSERQPALQEALNGARAGQSGSAVAAAEKLLRSNRVLRFNNLLDAAVAGVFLVLVSAIVALSIREWLLLLRQGKEPVLHETKPVWLPDYAVAEGKPLHLVGIVGLGLAVAKELSGEAEIERHRVQATHCTTHEHAQLSSECRERVLYLDMTERRFKGVRRCC